MIDQKLLSLLKVSELKSYTKAAQQLSITQPAVSQHIKALEQELGVRIFERINGQLVVTKQGEEVAHGGEQPHRRSAGQILRRKRGHKH